MLVDRRRPDSFFRPYYDILPVTLKNMPIFWEPHELRYLQGSYLVEQIEERNAAIKNDYITICNIVPEFGSISSLEEFKWARMCVCSRNFGLVINGVQTAAMVPYADMLNHFRPRESKWQFDDSLQAFTVIALQKISTGAQVYDSYGRKCNHRFLLNYGFSVENNVESDGYCPNEVRLSYCPSSI
jgi:histone-lysine N-methyltransferase SETD3